VKGVTGCIGPAQGPLDQQAPGFCAQKSSNCCALEPADGVAVAAPVSGDVVPPLPVSPDVVPLSVLDVPDPVESVLDELSEELLSLEVLLSELLLESGDAAEVGAWVDSGIATSAGGPGTWGAAASLPPQPAAVNARTATIVMRRTAPICLTPL
jgi:hypothetical protein